MTALMATLRRKQWQATEEIGVPFGTALAIFHGVYLYAVGNFSHCRVRGLCSAIL